MTLPVVTYVTPVDRPSNVASYFLNPLVWYAGLYSASAALLKLTGFCAFLWLARTLTVEEYAEFGLLYALQTGLITFALAGLIEAVVGLMREHRAADQRKTLFASANIAFLLMTMTAVVATFLASLIKQESTSVAVLACVTLSATLLAFSMFQAQMATLEEKHRTSLYFSFFPPMAAFVGGLIAFSVYLTVESFFLGAAIGAVCGLLGLATHFVGFQGTSEWLAATKLVLVKSTPFVAVALLSWLSGYGNNYVISGLFEPVEVARYTFVLTLSSIMQLIATALNQVWSPRFYRITHELPFGEVERKNRLFFRLQGLALGATGGVVIGLFPATMAALGGNLLEYRFMTLELFLLCSAYVVLSPWWHCHNYFLAYDKGPSVMRIALVTSAIGIAVWLLLMWLLGPLGIYIGFLTQMLLRSIGIAFAAKRYWPVKIAWDGVAVGIMLTLAGFVTTIF